ncbi:MAG TPA: glycosyltransferase family 4 protein [Bacteroidales bacterium]|nr:glycosyltransferase family 4 protein [Bacteroidales bacterium]
MKPRILVISNYNDFHTVRPEAEILLGLQRRGFGVDVMTYGGSEYARRFAEAGMKVIDFHPRHKFDRKECMRVRLALKEGAYDILQLFNSPASVTGLRAARGLPVKVVLYRGYTGNIHWYDPTAYLKYLHPRVDAVICNSLGVEQLLKRQLFFRKEKAVTINKGHDLSWYAGTEPADLKAFGIPEGAFTVACVANNRPMKGVPWLLRSLRHLSPGLPLHLLLLGRDMDTPRNRALIRGSGYEDRVHFPGFVPEVLRVVKACNAFVLPSLFGESITKSVLEAMCLGIPPLITDIPGNLELVEEGVSGLVVPPRNPAALGLALERLVREPQLAEYLGKGARERIQGPLNHQRSVSGYAALYERLTALTHRAER